MWRPQCPDCCSSLSRIWLFVTHGLQYTGLPCLSLSPRLCSNSCPLTRWCHPTISSSITPFSCPQSFPASGSFPMSQLFTAGDQSIGGSASTSVLPMNIQGWFPLGLTGVNDPGVKVSGGMKKSKPARGKNYPPHALPTTFPLIPLLAQW